MQRPDGMGADRYNERQNMRDAQHTPEPTHDLVAVDGNGQKLFETGVAFGSEEAESETERLNNPHPNERDTIPPEVDHYEARERDD